MTITSAGPALVRAETKMVVRDTSGMIIPIGMPLLILTMSGVGPAESRTESMTYALPMSMVMVIALIGVVNMPSFLAYYRKTGVLKRLAVTPIHPSMVLAAQVVVSVVQTIVGVALAITLGLTVFGGEPPERIGMAIAVFALASAAMYSLGTFVAAVSPTPNSAVAIGLVTFFVIGATGGMFGPAENLPDAMSTVGEHLPFGAALQSLGAAWQGQPVDPVHLVSLAVAVAVGSIAGTKMFRWS